MQIQLRSDAGYTVNAFSTCLAAETNAFRCGDKHFSHGEKLIY